MTAINFRQPSSYLPDQYKEPRIFTWYLAPDAQYHFQAAMDNFDVPDDKLAAFCSRWKIAELALFGSALRDDFRQDSDVDLLVTFAPETRWSLLDHVRMEEEARTLFGRDVDLITRRAVERSPNPIRRKAILGSTRKIYAAG